MPRKAISYTGRIHTNADELNPESLQTIRDTFNELLEIMSNQASIKISGSLSDK